VTFLGVVELGQIVEVIWVSLLAGVGITAAFSFVVLGLAGYVDSRGGARAGYLAMAVIAFAVFVGGVVFGVQIMLTKG
jgi:ABC-type spermidine/putrescine transport system permease subunit II